MIEAIVERAFPWGVFIGLGTLIGASFPAETRAAVKTAVRKSLVAADKLRGLSAEAYEKGQDVFAEARLEYEQLTREAEREAERGRLRVVQPPRRRASPSNGHHTSRRRKRSSGAETSATESR
jgi:hypothetical protein